MRSFLLILAAGVVCGVWFFLDLYYDADEFRKIEPHFNGELYKIPGVIGAEDITIHPAGLAFISSDDRRATQAGHPRKGRIYGYDLKASQPLPIDLTTSFGGQLHPHGISLYVEQDLIRLFVINHCSGSHFVEIFDYENSTLIHKESFKDSLLHSPNDLVAVGPRSFYVTNDHGNTSEPGKSVEEYLRLARSNVLYFDGDKFREVAGGLQYANGINISPDGAQVYIAATTENKMHIFRRNSLTGNLSWEKAIDIGTGIDNIEIDKEGNLWIAGHPKMLAFVRHARGAAQPSPSQVLKIVPRGKEYHIEEILLDDGRYLSGSSVATYFENRLLVGSVFEGHFLLGELN